MNIRHSDQSADEVHLALKAALKRMAEAKQCAVICFGEIMVRKLYRELGYSSVNQYAEKELGFSARRTGDFVMLCKKLEKLPLVKEQVATGQLGYTAARVIAPILDETNEKQWLDFASKNSRRDLEREVKRAKTDAVEKATVQTSRGELEIGTAELEQAKCDCRVSRPGARNTASISPAVRRQVLAQSRHKCQRPGCNNTRYLQIHHKVQRAHGGSNDLDNLICLCSACHRLLHDGFFVKSPTPVYRWASGELMSDVCPAVG